MTIMLGSSFDSFYGFGYLLLGAAIYLVIKFISDKRTMDKTLYVRDSGAYLKKKSITLDTGLDHLIGDTKNRLDSMSIAKGLAINMDELCNELAKKNGLEPCEIVGLDEELFYALKRAGFRIHDGFILSNGDPGTALNARKLYDRYVIVDGGPAAKLKNSYLREKFKYT